MTALPETLRVDELRLLEAEAVHIIREVVAELSAPSCCSLRAKTRSCYSDWRKRPFGRFHCRFR